MKIKCVMSSKLPVCVLKIIIVAASKTPRAIFIFPFRQNYLYNLDLESLVSNLLLSFMCQQQT